MLGGVEISFPLGLDGHSDADVVLHALMDALLGAAGLDDIGVHFPPTDVKWRDSSSIELLQIVFGLLPSDWHIENIDVTVVAEQPRIGPYREDMRRVVATTLQLEPSQVNIKATTNEGLGFIGREEGIAAFACATLTQSS